MVVILWIICWIVLVLGAFATFDRLLDVEYTSYRRNWEKDGKPHGFFWSPAEIRRLGFWDLTKSSTAHMRLRFDWLFVTPGWVRDNSEARFWLYAWRSLFLSAQAIICVPVLIDIVRSH